MYHRLMRRRGGRRRKEGGPYGEDTDPLQRSPRRAEALGPRHKRQAHPSALHLPFETGASGFSPPRASLKRVGVFSIGTSFFSATPAPPSHKSVVHRW